MLDWNTCIWVERDSAKVSGAWVFKNTRVPVKALFANVEGGRVYRPVFGVVSRGGA